MTTIKRFNPDYAMHAARFEAFARETEHGEYVRFDAHQQTMSALEAERDAQQKRADALAVENAALKKIGDHLAADLGDVTEEAYPSCEQWWQIETQATDAAIAAIKAQVVEKFVTKISKQLREAGGERGYNLVDWCEYADHLEDRGEKFAAELREAK